VDVLLKEQRVKVDTTLSYETVELAIKNTGKTVVSGKVITDPLGKPARAVPSIVGA